MLRNSVLYVLRDSLEAFESGESNILVVNKTKYEEIEQVEVNVSKVLERESELRESMTDMDLYESALDEVESARRLTVLPAIEELEELLRNEHDLMKKKNLITLIDNLLWTEQQIMKIKEA